MNSDHSAAHAVMGSALALDSTQSSLEGARAMNSNPVNRRRVARAFGDVLRNVRSKAGSARGVDPTQLVSDTIARVQEKG